MHYQQLHLGKVKLNGIGGIRHHLLDRERVKTNPNIDLTRSHLNHSIGDLSPEHLERNVRQRIKQLHLKRKPRSDDVGLADIIVGASSDFMLQLGTEKREQKLQIDFHQQVSRLYGLERGQHHARNYLELNQFKAQQAKQELQQYTEDLNTILL